MADKTGIEWTDATWNPLVGCSIKSAGCANCYAMRQAARLDLMGVAHYAGLTQPSNAGPVWNGVVREAPPSIMAKPIRWRRPRRIFVNSMSDLFHESVPFETIDRVFAIMALCPQHTFQVLTKRADRMRAYMERLDGLGGIGRVALLASLMSWAEEASGSRLGGCPVVGHPLPNVWLGVTVEDQRAADERIPDLLNTSAAIRWLSVEPMIGPVLPWTPWIGDAAGLGADRAGIDWVVAGGESGPGARPMHIGWLRAIRDQCAAAGVPFLFKQWGEYVGATGQVGMWAYCENGQAIATNHDTVDLGDGYLAQRVGKRRAGRSIDGRTHDEYPAGAGA